VGLEVSFPFYLVSRDGRWRDEERIPRGLKPTCVGRNVGAKAPTPYKKEYHMAHAKAA
jgi:hypothetical protein